MEWTTEVGCAYSATITVADESGGKIAITVQLKDYAGNNLTVANSITAYWASDTAGLIYAVNDLSPDLAAADAATTGSLAVTLANGVYQLVSNVAGLIVLDAAKTETSTAAYLVLVLPNGKLVVSKIVQIA